MPLTCYLANNQLSTLRSIQASHDAINAPGRVRSDAERHVILSAYVPGNTHSRVHVHRTPVKSH